MKKENVNKFILFICFFVILISIILKKDKNTHFDSTGYMISQANENRMTSKSIPAKLRWE